MFRKSLARFARTPIWAARGARCALVSPRQPNSSSCYGWARLNSKKAGDTAELKMDKPQLMIAFTCKKCDTRSSHVFSKQAYNTGSVLIQCPGCKNRHLIADNLNMFGDDKVNLEELLKAQGELVATTTNDLAFEDIPESLRSILGHHAKDAPDQFHKDESRLLEEKKDL